MSAKSKESGKSIHSSFVLSRDNLAKLKQKAVRRGCWYKELKQNERMLLDLTIRVVEKVRSFMLAKVVFRLVGRLFEAMESRIVCLIRTEGFEMVKRLSKIGESLGCKSAKNWVRDKGFMQFLVISNLGEFGK